MQSIIPMSSCQLSLLYEQGFERFDDSSTFNGKGKSVAKDITDMFLWTGWVYDGQ